MGAFFYETAVNQTRGWARPQIASRSRPDIGVAAIVISKLAAEHSQPHRTGSAHTVETTWLNLEGSENLVLPNLSRRSRFAS